MSPVGVSGLRVPRIHPHAELRRLLRCQHTDDFLEGSIQGGVDPGLHRVPGRIHVLLMPSEDLLDPLLLGGGQIQLAGQTVEHIVSCRGNDMMGSLAAPS